MALHSRICEIFGIRYPVVVAGMGGASVPRLAAAVSNADGLGVLGAAASSPEELRAWMREVRSLTDKPQPQPLPMPFQSMIAGPVLAATTEARRKDMAPGFAGQGMGLVKAVRPAREVLEDLVAGAEAALARADRFR